MGIGCLVYEFVYDYLFFYGIGVVLIVLLVGWGVVMVFRRDWWLGSFWSKIGWGYCLKIG